MPVALSDATELEAMAELETTELETAALETAALETTELAANDDDDAAEAADEAPEAWAGAALA